LLLFNHKTPDYLTRGKYSSYFTRWLNLIHLLKIEDLFKVEKRLTFDFFKERILTKVIKTNYWEALKANGGVLVLYLHHIVYF